MQRLTITLMNLYDADETLLDLLQLPEQINRDDFIGRLMIDIGESEVCITNPRIMKTAIGCWSRGRLPVWKRLANIQDLEYNPIWNVDGDVLHSGQRSGSRTAGRTVGRTDTERETYGRDRTWTETENQTSSGSETRSEDKAETSTGFISADNVESWSNDTKSETETGTDSNSSTSGQMHTDKSGTENIDDLRNRTENGSENISDTEDSSGSDSWTERRTGNIGVTTTQKMLTEEQTFWEQYDIIGYIINQFAHEFCLLVY